MGFFLDEQDSPTSAAPVAPSGFFLDETPAATTKEGSVLGDLLTGAARTPLSFGAMAADVISYPFRVGASYVPGLYNEEQKQIARQAFPFSKEMQEVTLPALGLERKDSLAQRVGEYASPMGTANLARQLITGTGAGTGAYLATQVAPDSAVSEMIGAVLGGGAPNLLTKTTRGMIKPFSTKGQQTLAGEELLAAAGREGVENLQTRLKEVDSIRPFTTYAEIAQTPSAAAYQTALRREPGETQNLIEQALSQRQAARETAIKALAPDALSSVSPQVRGEFLQEQASKIIDSARKTAGQAYEELGNVTGISIAKQKYQIGKKLADSFQGSAVPESGTMKHLRFVLDGPKERSFQELKAVYEDAGAEIGKIARENPKAKDISVLKTLRTQVMKAVDEAAENGVLDPAQKTSWNKAKEGYALMGEKFGTPTLRKITQKGEYGKGFKMSEEQAVSEIIKTRRSAEQFIKAFGGDQSLVNTARSALIDEMSKKPISSWPKFVKDREDIFKEIFQDTEKISKEAIGKAPTGVVGDYVLLKRVINNISSEEAVKEMATRASRGQSATAQYVTTAKKLLEQGPRVLNRILAKDPVGIGGGAAIGSLASVPGAIIGVVAGKAVSKAAQNSEEIIKNWIARGIADKETLKLLVSRATEENVKRATERMLSSVLETTAKGSSNISTGTKDRDFVNSAIEEAQKRIDMKNKETEKGPIETPKVISAKRVEIDNDLKPLVTAVIGQESAGNPNAVSSKGAVGLMQIMPATAKEIAKELGVENYDLRDPATNQQFGSHYLKKLLVMFDYDVSLALAAYNAGPGKVKQWVAKYGDNWADIQRELKKRGHYTETVKYVPSTLKRLAKNVMV